MSMSILASALRLFKRVGVEEVRLTGGEPTIHSSFGKVLSHIHESGYPIGITTNGLLLFRDRQVRRRVLETVRRIWISVYGVSQDGHDTLRAGAGWPLDDTLKNIAKLTSGYKDIAPAPSIGVRAVVSWQELLQVPSFLTRIADLGIQRVHLIPLQYDGRARTLDMPDAREFLVAYELLIRASRTQWRRHFLELRFSDPTDVDRRYENHEDSCFLNDRIMLSIAPSGHIFPCCFLVYEKHHNLGHVHDPVLAMGAFDKTTTRAHCKGLDGSIWPGVSCATSCPIRYV